MHYGPNDEWYECYLVFPEAAGEALRQQQLLPHEQPFWQLRDPGHIESLFERLLLFAREEEPLADRLDRLAAHIVVEGQLTAAPAEDAVPPSVVTVRKLLERDYQQDHDLAALAEQYDLSYGHFSPWLWAQHVGQPAATSTLLLLSSIIRDVLAVKPARWRLRRA